MPPDRTVKKEKHTCIGQENDECKLSSPFAKKLSELLDFETRLQPSKHLFQSELKQAQNAKKEEKKEARKVREEEKKKVRENFLKEILERCAADRCIVTVNKSSTDKLGIGIQDYMNSIKVMVIEPNSLFDGTDLETGMILERINGNRYSSFQEGKTMLVGAEGQLTITGYK